MWEGVERIVVAAEPYQVWEVVTDVAGHAALAGSGEIQELRISGAVRLGTTWEADIAVPGLDEGFVSRSEVVSFDPPVEFSWTSVPRPVIPGDPRSIPGVRWWFRLEDDGEARTVVEHSFRVTPPDIGAADLAEFFEETNRVETIRAGMRVTLERLKATVEGTG